TTRFWKWASLTGRLCPRCRATAPHPPRWPSVSPTWTTLSGRPPSIDGAPARTHGTHAMLITNATLITWGESPRILPDYALLIEGDRIAALGPAAEVAAQAEGHEVVDARGQFVMPGNICAHTHFYGAFARGMAIPGDPPKDF